MLRLGKRKGAEQDRVNDGEDGGVGSDTEAEHEDGREGECGALAQHAQGEPEILKKIFDGADAASVAGLLFSELDATEVSEGGAAGVFGRETGRGVLLCFSFEVVAEFVVEVAFDIGAAEKRAQAKGNCGKRS